MQFTSLDLVFIFLYIFLVLIVAYVRTRKKSDEEFLIASRKVGILGSVATINASKTGSIILIFTAAAYVVGFSAMWYFIGNAAGYLLFLFFAVRLFKKYGKKHYTFADYFFHNYGALSGKIASSLNILIMFSWLTLNMIASSKVLSFFTGLQFETAAIIVAVFVLAYLLMGGFKAVVTTDIIQYGAIVGIFFIFAILFMTGTTIPMEEFDMTQGGIGYVFGFFLIGIIIPFASPDLWQRVYAVKNIRTLKRSFIFSIVVYLCVGALLAMIGLAIKTHIPGADPDIALVQGFAQLLPAGLAGLAVVIFFAAFMSSIDTYAYTAASSLIHGFVHRQPRKKTVRFIKFAITGCIVASTLLAILIKDLLLGTFIFAGYTIILAIPVILTWIRPSVKSRTLNIGFILSITGLSLFVVHGALTNSMTPFLIVQSVGCSVIGLCVGAMIGEKTVR